MTRRAKLNWIRWNPWNVFSEYFAMTSDAFFTDKGVLLSRRRPNVVFVDGLHTFEQSLRDVENSLACLAPGGVIVIDDCNPQSASAADPVRAPTQTIWNGDVWKTIVFLRAARPDLNVFTLDCVYGLGILTRRSAERLLNENPATIGSLPYEHLERNRAELLDLKPPAYFQGFLESL